jgi:hypothetical protein
MKTRWTITLDYQGDDDGTQAVRRLLKSAWRAYGLKCVGVDTLPEPESTRKTTTPPEPARTPARGRQP